jgi:methionyl-tRNA formyltransferase
MNDDESEVVQILRELSPDSKIRIISSKSDLDNSAQEIQGRVLLISFDSGILIPAEILDSLTVPAYNFHPAPPEFPGRDPHHFAVYEGVEHYGATAHEMLPSVDAGQIVGVERFKIDKPLSPHQLLTHAREHLLVLFRRLAPQMVRGKPLEAVKDNWGERKTTRKDFLSMCEIPHDVDEAEFNRRYLAFDGHHHDNLFTVIHGHQFRIKKN